MRDSSDARSTLKHSSEELPAFVAGPLRLGPSALQFTCNTAYGARFACLSGCSVSCCFDKLLYSLESVSFAQEGPGLCKLYTSK